ncbi:MAG: hypothetical protein JXA93_02910 [Anaerolineae bacterium]|nr:hypothetical protein [Anaerolineae bacterium]
MSVTARIARILKVPESEARRFCFRVQRQFKKGSPRFVVIEKVLKEHPNATPREVARIIAPDLTYVFVKEPAQPPPPRSPQQREEKNARKAQVLRKRLVRTLADLVPGKDCGNEGKAHLLLLELEARYPRTGELSNADLVTTIRKACKGGELDLDAIVPLVKRQVEGLGSDDVLVAAVASVLPGDKKGDLKEAQRLLRNLEHEFPASRKMSNRQLLRAVQRAARREPFRTYQVVEEVRKALYGSRGDSNWVSIVSTPMGGQPKR